MLPLRGRSETVEEKIIVESTVKVYLFIFYIRGPWDSAVRRLM